MNLIQKAFTQLYPEKQLNKTSVLKYSDKFKPYNANVRYSLTNITFNLSKKWKTIDEEIKIGLLQYLLVKIYKQKRKTINIQMYDIFMKKLWTVAPRVGRDSDLMESFQRVNREYFDNLLEIPNLIWGNPTTTKLGSYEYATDIIKISSIFKNQPTEFLDYIMHHEMLHKKLQYKNSGIKTMHHTAEFRLKEKSFKNADQIERRLKYFLGKKKTKNLIHSIFFK